MKKDYVSPDIELIFIEEDLLTASKSWGEDELPGINPFGEGDDW